ncbi:MAG: zinc metallopeptidase [Deltaproteobacteria bacterium]|nr:zinc metallopeptidase [Deltaproteobacteria bacterium]MBW2137973.1 zinc metallopeptidase [Deltaproteobacteria bacterium]
MTSRKQCVGLLPIGDIPDIILKTISAHILGYYNLDSVILEARDYPEYAFDHRRLQFDAAAIIERLESDTLQGCTKIIGVIDSDIFHPVFTHVFGEARQEGKCALVSVKRLKKNPDGSLPPLSVVLERVAKVALHELGHLFSLVHCLEDHCLMRFAGSLEGLDGLRLSFCKYCAALLREALGPS